MYIIHEFHGVVKLKRGNKSPPLLKQSTFIL